MSVEAVHRQSTLDPQNPWPGLKPFSIEDTAFFQGRESMVNELFSWVNRSALTVLYGRSGLGKTSLLQAGLFPRLRQADYLPVLIRLDHSQADLTAPALASQVKQKLVSVLADQHIDAPAPDPEETLWAYFHRKGLEFWDERNRLVQPVLIFDQFEEIYTHGSETKAARERADVFLDELGALTENRPPAAIRQQLEADPKLAKSFDFDSHTVRVILSVREDYLPFLLKQRRRFSGVSYNQCRLEPMNGEEAWQVILQPGGANLIDETTALRILSVVTSSHDDEPQGLPPLSRTDLPDLKVDPALLNVVCRGLNDERQKRDLPTITPDLVEEIHGSILERFYETALEGMPYQTRLFIEDRLLSSSGEYRQSAALKEACEAGEITREQAGLLVDRRLLHLEERDGVPHLELSHDRLTQVVKKSRENRRRKRQLELARRRTRQLTAAAVALGLALISLIWAGAEYYDGHFRQHVYYYTNFTKMWGIAHGIGKRLTLEAIKERAVSLRFTYRGTEQAGRLLNAAAIDSQGNLTTHHNIGTYLQYAADTEDDPRRECQWEWAVDAEGNLIREMAFDRHHQLVWALNLSVRDAANANDKDKDGRITRTGFFAGPNGLPLRSKEKGVQYIRITYDRNGYEVEHAYENGAGTPLTALDGAFGKRFQYDKLGQIVAVTSVGIDHQPMNDETWSATLKVEYDDAGNVTARKVYDANGRPTLTSRWLHCARCEYDRWGNEICETYFGPDGKTPCLTKEGYAGCRVRYEHGRLRSTTYIGIDGQPCLTNPKIAIVEENYREDGRETEHSFYDVSHKHSPNNEGIGGWKDSYNPEGYLESRVYIGLDGQPYCRNKEDGTTGWTSKFDNKGNEIERTFLGPDGKPGFTKKNIAGWRKEYDDQGRQTKISYYDPDGKRCLNFEQIAGWTTEYNELGYQAKRKFIGTDGQPTLSNLGYAGITWEYNGYGKPLQERYFGLQQGPDGKDIPALANAARVAGWQYEYDDLQRKRSSSAIGLDGNPCVSSAGFWSLRSSYDGRGLITAEDYLGLDGKPCVVQPANGGVGGFASIKTDHDELGRVTSESFWDADGKLRLDSEGIAGWSNRYDDPNHPDRETMRMYFGEDRTAILLKGDGIAGWQKNYDARGRVLKETFLGSDGKPCLGTLNVAGWKFTYDERDRAVKEEYFGVDGETSCLSSEDIAGWKSDYDSEDREIRRVYLGLNGDPTQSAVLGKAGWEKEFDARGNPIREVNLDVNLKPIVGVPMFVLSNVFGGSQAEQLGLARGDVLVRYADWSAIGNDSEPKITPATQEIQRNITIEVLKPGSENRELWVVRQDKVQHTWKLLKFAAKPGRLGIMYSPVTISDESLPGILKCMRPDASPSDTATPPVGQP